MDESSCGALRSTPAIAPPPARSRAASDLVRLLPYLGPYRVRWLVMVTAAVTSVAATVAIPLMVKAVIDGPVRHHDHHRLWLLGGVALAVGVAEAVQSFVRRWIVASATTAVEADVRNDLFARLQVLPMSFHGQWQSGQLLSRVMNDLGTIRRFVEFPMVFLPIHLLHIMVVTGILLAMYWPLGVVVVLSIAPIVVSVQRFEHEFVSLSRQAQDQSGHVATHVEESTLGLRVVKSFGREDFVFDRFDQQASALCDIEVRKAVVLAKFRTLLDVMPSLTLIVVLGLAAYAAGSGHVTVGTLVAFITLLLSMAFPISSLGMMWSMMQESMTAASRVAAIFDAPREITDGPRDVIPCHGRLELIDVGFRAPGSQQWILRHVTVTVEPGETLALVGPTGSGKSVLVALLSRLYDVSEGQIRVDGQDIRDLSLSALRQVVATAFEEPVLFSMSVAENLRLGRPDATDAELADAIEVAAAQFVYALPFGLDTRIGEQGMSVSGGQRQRLALARAIVVAPKILVLDDTLSALDVHTEARVIAALRPVLGASTGVLIAHRASTMQLANKVALLDWANGHATITHIGTHTELLAWVPRYRSLLAADDQLQDGSRPVYLWENDEQIDRLRHAHAEQEVVDEVCFPPGFAITEAEPR
ncbi:MAG: ABC transporter ATP-binding protein/permease [Mycobacteriaceae bacterium]|nr:ABC transporter ATP-binding protein/permease [Mycobacteriaceae bacterium]